MTTVGKSFSQEKKRKHHEDRSIHMGCKKRGQTLGPKKYWNTPTVLRGWRSTSKRGETNDTDINQFYRISTALGENGHKTRYLGETGYS